ncbi:MAG: fatty-acid--CoA ligase, partial [Comamonadaceae bacterium]
ADADLSHLKSFVMGGSPVPASLPGEIAARLPDLVLANVWGLTEATSIATFTDGADYLEHPNSAGKPIDGVAVQVSVDGAPPSDVRNAVGELCVKGPVVTGGYWNNFVATAETYVDEWLHTGDVGYIDDDGHVHVKDRLKDMIIRGGENIYSLEVETVLGTHPDVAEVAVIGIPDDVLGEKVCAVIVPADEDRPPTTVELTAHAAKSLADYKIPAVFRLASQLPRNATGKVLKRALTATSQTMIGDTLK